MPSALSAGLGQHSPQAAALEFSRPFVDPQISDQATVLSLRFCKSQRGCLGALASSGDFKVFQIQKQHVFPLELGKEDDSGSDVQAISTKRIWHVEKASDGGFGSNHEFSRVVSFDFSHLRGAQGQACAVVLRADNTIGLHGLESPPPSLSISLLGGLVAGKCYAFKSQDMSGDETTLGSMVDMTLAKGDDWSDVANDPFNYKAQVTSREAHNRLTKPKKDISLEKALSLPLKTRHRCLQGYLFNCRRNAEIVSEDPWLQNMWAWIARRYPYSK